MHLTILTVLSSAVIDTNMVIYHLVLNAGTIKLLKFILLVSELGLHCWNQWAFLFRLQSRPEISAAGGLSMTRWHWLTTLSAPCRYVMIYLCSEKVKNCVCIWWNCFHQKKKKSFCLLFPTAATCCQRKESCSLWSHQLFGSARHLVSAEQMRLEAGWGVWFLSNYTVSVRAASLKALLFWKKIRGGRVFRFSDSLTCCRGVQ